MKISCCLSILGFALVTLQVQVRGQVSPLSVSSPSTNSPTGPQVTMGWNASPDPSVVGYYLCWGLASGQATNYIDVRSVTNTALGGLTTNEMYYFTVVAYDAVGNQALPSNEIQYMVTNTLAVAPGIVVDLTNQSVIVGSTVSFQIMASGTSPLSYQWRFNGTNLAGASSNVLSLGGVTPSQGGQYQVIVTNAAGAATSSVATLTILVPPSISTDLANQTVPANSNVTFQVGVSGTRPLGYQWLFNGTNLPGATSNPLTLLNVAQQQAGTYQVMVSNSAATVASSVANLIVLLPPNIVGNLTNQMVALGSNATFLVRVTGSSPLTYQWLFNGSTLAGASSNPLVLNNVDSTKSGAYQVVVSNSVGSVTSATANLKVLTPPTIATDVARQTVAVGSNVTFQVGVSGSGPFGYQWLFEGTNLPTGITNPLVLSNVTSAEAGTYQVIVTNAVGTATSSIASLTVLVPPSIVTNPANQSIPFGSNAVFQVGVAGSGPLGYQWLFNGANLPGATANPLVLANADASQTGTYQLIVSNAVGTARSSLASLSLITSPSIVVDLTNQVVAPGSNAVFQVGVVGTPPLRYQWLFNGANLASATTDPLLLPDVGTNQAGNYQVVVANEVGAATSAVAHLMVIVPPAIVADLTNQTATPGTNVYLQVGVSGTAPLAYQWLFNGTNLPGATSVPLILSNVSPTESGTYQMIVSNSLGSAISSIATLSILSPPAITNDLFKQTVAAGSSLNLQVGTIGSKPLGFQWLFDGVAISGATSNPLVLGGVTPAQGGTYQVVVTNAVGSVTSALALVTVLTPPSIFADLTNQSVVAGGSVSFRVGASGTGPLSFQWLFNGAALAGVTSNVLNLTNVGLSLEGSYQVIVSNALGSVTSASATLSVLGSSSLSVTPLSGGSFNVTCSGPPLQSYEIQFCTNLSSAWQLLGTVTADASGLAHYVASGTGPSGFFRAFAVAP